MSKHFRQALRRWWITPEDAARYTGESVEQIEAWCRDGVKLPRERRVLPFLIVGISGDVARRLLRGSSWTWVRGASKRGAAVQSTPAVITLGVNTPPTTTMVPPMTKTRTRSDIVAMTNFITNPRLCVTKR